MFVWCVIVKDNRTIVSGWNGRLPNNTFKARDDVPKV